MLTEAPPSALVEARGLCRYLLVFGKKARNGFEAELCGTKYRLVPSFISPLPASPNTPLSGSPDMVLMTLLSTSRWTLQFVVQMDEATWKIPLVDFRGKSAIVEHDNLSAMPGWWKEYERISNARLGSSATPWNHNSEYMGMCYVYKYGVLKPTHLLADPENTLLKDLTLVKLDVGELLASLNG